jgi:hypothetical protein
MMVIPFRHSIRRTRDSAGCSSRFERSAIAFSDVQKHPDKARALGCTQIGRLINGRNHPIDAIEQRLEFFANRSRSTVVRLV